LSSNKTGSEKKLFLDHYAQSLTRNGDIVVDQDEINKISKEIKRYIIKQHMKTYYHTTIGILCFLLGTFFGLLIK
jgi:hypothetical protein